MNKSNNVYSSAKVVKNSEVQEYQLGTFVQDEAGQTQQVNLPPAVLNTSNINGDMEAVLTGIKNLNNQLNEMNSKIVNLENNGATAKDIDAQVVQAIKDLKHYANFFEQATFQMETKLLKTSISIAQKIIAIEIGENSSAIAKQTITHLLDKIKNASKVKIHLNPKDFELLRNELKLESFIQLVEDPNVTAGGVVIASDLGNFDGNIEAKVSTMLESLDNIL
ncbi:FliH/SctL family protein [Halarcobacter bivalviorum]|uniref:Flagellar assembly protein FliH n=1 Tax=Halarcobacter bivalviorum TaxID=663364 RepID=A0AAX2A8H9_9BACT|nr:FliH/SctL family protein [Halarcobacter bivalviorum]AXH11477.1 flagellar export apparatus, cytoplasmic ATPase complex, FliH component [Halarcobacter bivalviorum]RXK09338.1 flagellar assembly protein FliH [Halarcobacter bivalviorum]